MRGGFIHNVILITALAELFELEGWRVDTEVPIRVGTTIRFVDLVAEREGYCIAVEAECSPKRIEGDLDKARALGAQELWIVTPNTRIAAGVRRKLDRLFVPVNRDGLFVLTQGAAKERIMNGLPLFAGS